MGISNNIEKFTTELRPYHARLVAVSKTHPAPAILDAYHAGQRLFGENKAQEVTGKVPLLPADIEWHFIGHLQRNKVKLIAPFVSMIHAVDSLRLLEEIDKNGQKFNRVIPCLIQVFIATEETKFGLSPEELSQLLDSPSLGQFRHVRIDGLMGMASLTGNHEQIRNEFRGLRKLFDSLKRQPLHANVQMKELSMGMSADYKIALEEGSTLVRIGTAIFGART